MKFNVSKLTINGTEVSLPENFLAMEAEQVVPTPPPEPAPPPPPSPPPEPAPPASYETFLPSTFTGLIVYVSSSLGEDANAGTRLAPKKTLAAAAALLRHGKPDQLLLRCGDVWNESFGRWKKGGESANSPLVIGAYGIGPRPLLKTGPNVGLEVSSGAGTPLQVNNLLVQGIEFFADTRHPSSPNFSTNGSNGVRWVNAGENISFVDCKFSYYKLGMSIECPSSIGVLKNVTLNGCIIVDSYNTSGHSQGVYISNVRSGLSIKNCVFDKNGHGDLASPEDDPTLYNHNIYLQADCGLDTEVSGNIISRASSHGVQMRAGGLFMLNVLVRNPIGYMGGYDTEVPNSQATVLDNVILNGTDISPSYKRGWGMEFKKIASGRVENNIVAHSKASPNFSARSIQVAPNVSYKLNKIWKWSVGTQVECLPATTGPYIDPERSIESFCAMKGLAPDISSFYSLIRSCSIYNSPTALCGALNDYFFEGFAPA